MRNVILLSLSAAFFMSSAAFGTEGNDDNSAEKDRPKSCIPFLQLIDNSKRFVHPMLETRWIPSATSTAIYDNMVNQNYDEGRPFFSRFVNTSLTSETHAGPNVGVHLSVRTLPADNRFTRKLPTVPSNIQAVLRLELRTVTTRGLHMVRQAGELEQGRMSIQRLFSAGFLDESDVRRIMNETAGLFEGSVLSDKDRVSSWIMGSGSAILQIKLDHLTAAEFAALINNFAARIDSGKL